MRIEDIEYEAEGIQLIGQLAVDDQLQGARPAVLVCHEGPGLDDHAKGRALRLAELGYVAFALDYHGGGKPLPMDQMMARLGPLMGDPLKTRSLGQAGLEVLLRQPETDASRVAAIGFCFGGTMSLELARGGADLKAVVGFHSGLATARPAGRQQHHRQGAGVHRRRGPARSRPSSASPSRRRCAPAASTGA